MPTESPWCTASLHCSLSTRPNENRFWNQILTLLSNLVPSAIFIWLKIRQWNLACQSAQLVQQKMSQALDLRSNRGAWWYSLYGLQNDDSSLANLLGITDAMLPMFYDCCRWSHTYSKGFSNQPRFKKKAFVPSRHPTSSAWNTRILPSSSIFESEASPVVPPPREAKQKGETKGQGLILRPEQISTSWLLRCWTDQQPTKTSLRILKIDHWRWRSEKEVPKGRKWENSEGGANEVGLDRKTQPPSGVSLKQRTEKLPTCQGAFVSRGELKVG